LGPKQQTLLFPSVAFALNISPCFVSLHIEVSIRVSEIHQCKLKKVAAAARRENEGKIKKARNGDEKFKSGQLTPTIN